MAGPLTPLPLPPSRPTRRRRPLAFMTLVAILFVLGAVAVRLAVTPPAGTPPPSPPTSTTAPALDVTPAPITEPTTMPATPTATATRVQLPPTATTDASTTTATAPAAPTTATPAPGPSATPTMTPAWAPPTRTPTIGATVSPTASPPITATATASRPTPASLESERVRNGDFEAGFSEQGLATWWNRFSNGAASVLFGDENQPPAVYDSYHAQLIRIEAATRADRYAGIYQVVNVVPGATYRLSLHGLIRSGLGDVAQSQYGYRMQLGLDYAGGKDWRRVTDWIELPWDEQPFDAPEFTYGSYEERLQAVSPRLTIFIRAWSKWAEPSRADYTVDGVSLIGPKPIGAAGVDDQ